MAGGYLNGVEVLGHGVLVSQLARRHDAQSTPLVEERGDGAGPRRQDKNDDAQLRRVHAEIDEMHARHTWPVHTTTPRRLCDHQHPAFSGVGTMGTGGTLYPPSSGLVPPVPPQVKDVFYVKILSKRL